MDPNELYPIDLALITAFPYFDRDAPVAKPPEPTYPRLLRIPIYLN